MSITSAMYTGVSGLVNNGEAMNVIGNNISNVNTTGFKYGRMLFSDMLSATIDNNSQIGRGVQIQKVDNVFGQSTFETTELTTDLAIQGSSFFALGAPTAAAGSAVAATDAYYTRAGAFRVDQNGFLVNPDGYRVLDENRVPIQFVPTAPATFGKVTSIGADGTINWIDSTGAQFTHASQVGLALIPDTGMMEKMGGTLFTASAATGITNASVAAPNGTSERLFSNSLELSNVDMAAQFVKMIMTQRAYSANSKTITTVDEMTQEVLNIKR